MPNLEYYANASTDSVSDVDYGSCLEYEGCETEDKYVWNVNNLGNIPMSELRTNHIKNIIKKFPINGEFLGRDSKIQRLKNILEYRQMEN